MVDSSFSTASAVLLIQPGSTTGDHVVVTGNSFLETAVVPNILLYDNTGPPITVTDVVADNVFNLNTSNSSGDVSVEGSVRGLSIQNNRFTNNNDSTAIALSGNQENMSITGNSILITGWYSVGIYLDGLTVSALIANNVINTGNGYGLEIEASSSPTNVQDLNIQIQQNDFRSNLVGVMIDGNGPLTGIDLGGGSQHSLGDNDFRGDLTNASDYSPSGAIWVDDYFQGPSTTLSARFNIFSGSPTASIFAGYGSATVDASAPRGPGIRYVVAPGATIDNVTAFASLHDALTLNPAGMAAGDVIQIEPGSTPGALQPGDLSSYPGNGGEGDLTIQGNPTDPLAQVPAFQLTGSETFLSPIVFNNVNVQVAGGSPATLTFQNDVYIIGSSFVVVEDQQTAPVFCFSPTFAGIQQTISGATITNQSPIGDNNPLIQVIPSMNVAGVAVTCTGTTFINNAALTGGSNSAILLVSPTGSGAALTFTGNTLQNAGGANDDFLYENTGAAVTVSDTVTSNTFLDSANASHAVDFEEEGPVNGLSIQDNTFTDAASGTTAIELDAQTQNTQVMGNNIHLSSGATGVFVAAGQGGGTTTSAILANNAIDTGGPSNGGTGLVIDSGTTATDALILPIQANDFTNNQIGVAIHVLGRLPP